MCRKAIRVLFVAFVGFAGVGEAAIRAQERLEPPKTGIVYRIQGKTYERLSFGENGELESHELISFGELVPREKGCELPIHVTAYDPTDDSRVKGDTEIALTIEDCEPHFVANILTLAGELKDQTIQAKVAGAGTFYPPDPIEGLDLPGLRFTLIVKRGVLSALGTKTKVFMTNRTVKVTSSEGGPDPRPLTYEIHCTIKVKIFLLGLPVKSLSFSSRQVLDVGQGLIEEVLDHDNGARTIFRAVPH